MMLNLKIHGRELPISNGSQPAIGRVHPYYMGTATYQTSNITYSPFSCLPKPNKKNDLRP
jgi:hypothetical protein